MKLKITAFLLSFISIIGLGIGLFFVFNNKKPNTFEKIRYEIKNNNHKFKKFDSVYKDNQKKHYILMMIDSLTSFRLHDSIEKLEDFYKNPVLKNSTHKITTHDLAIIKEKLDLFKEFNLKMNVITPAYRTDKGYQGVIAGPFGSLTTAEFMRKEDRMKNMNQYFFNLFESIGQSDNIDKIYIQTAEFLNAQYARDQFNTSWSPSMLPISKKAKDKIDTSQLKSKVSSNDSVISASKIIDPHKNTFSLFTYDGIHNGNSYTYPLGKPWSLKEDNLFNMLTLLKRTLKKKKIWDTTEIMITSDHGKTTSESNTKYKYGSKYFGKEMTIVDLVSDPNNFLKEATFEKSDEKYDVKEYESMTSWSSILHKKRFSSNTSLKEDFKSIYMNSDAIVQLFYNMGIDPYYLEFNYYEYINEYKNLDNKNGDFNSFINNPFNSDLSKRRLITLDADIYATWGLNPETWIGFSGSFYTEPWWTKDKNGNIAFNQNAILRFYLDDKEYPELTWFEKLKIKEIKDKGEKGGLKVMGALFKYLDEFKLKNSNN